MMPMTKESSAISQIFRECVMVEPIFSPMTSMDISAPSMKQPSPTMSRKTPTRKSTNVPVSRGTKATLRTRTMSAMGRMEVSDSMILSLSACVIYGPPFAVYGGLLAVFLFDRRDLIDSALMFCLPREGRCKESLYDVEP